jgi:hypothetical protein
MTKKNATNISAVAKKYGVSRTTIRRSCRGVDAPGQMLDSADDDTRHDLDLTF